MKKALVQVPGFKYKSTCSSTWTRVNEYVYLDSSINNCTWTPICNRKWLCSYNFWPRTDVFRDTYMLLSRTHAHARVALQYTLHKSRIHRCSTLVRKAGFRRGVETQHTDQPAARLACPTFQNASSRLITWHDKRAKVTKWQNDSVVICFPLTVLAWKPPKHHLHDKWRYECITAVALLSYPLFYHI